MKSALPLCALLFLPLVACDPGYGPEALDLVVGSEDRPEGVSDDGLDPEDRCGHYCNEYRATCGSEHFAYASDAECQSLCPYWEDEDAAENLTAKCRLEALGAIDLHDGSSVDKGCEQAGPDSATCGTAYVITCARYCDSFGDACGGGGDFADGAACEAWCAGVQLEGTGDTIECRMDYLGTLLTPPDCSDAGPDSSACN